MTQGIDDIKIIREMMEKSSKFRYINGLSLIVAGLTAMAGAVFAHFYLMGYIRIAQQNTPYQRLVVLFLAALTVLTIAASVITFFSWLKAKENRQSIINRLTKRVIYNLAVPLVTGGALSLLFLFQGKVSIVYAFTLIFYGLSLVNVSKFTFGEIHILGLCEIILGLMCVIFIGDSALKTVWKYSSILDTVSNGLLWWTIGFGLLHIIFGLIIYFKYDRKRTV